MPSNKWATGLCNCLSYRDLNGSCQCCPTFFPQALCGPCCIDGEIHTIMNQQKACCCRMSKRGWCQCLIEVPFAIFGPFGGIAISICCGVKTRSDVKDAYDIGDDKSCCNSCVGMCYPCSLFQILMTLREFETKGIKPNNNMKQPLRGK